jgi:hypothetical protein
MRIDLYTKAVLTIIAVMLAVIAANQLASPRVASAQGPFTGVQFDAKANSFFDSRTGEVWYYDSVNGTGKLAFKERLTKLGQPLVVEKVK